LSSSVYQRNAAHEPFGESGWWAVQNDITRAFKGLKEVTNDLAGFDPALKDLTEHEIQQLQNINLVTISNTQWGYLGAMDQGVATTDSPTFSGMTLNGTLLMSGANEINWRDSDLAIWSSADSILNVKADGYVEINGILNLEQTSATTGQITQNGGTLVFHTYGGDNIYVGPGAGNLTTTSSLNVGVGFSALGNVTTGSQNMALGATAMEVATTIADCTAVGAQALRLSTTGVGRNVAVGTQSLRNAGASTFCTGVGYQSLVSMSGGTANTAIGYQALFTVSIGTNNTALGFGAGLVAAASSGSVYLGYLAGRYETASNKLFIDNAARASEADGRVKALVYGEFNAATASQLFRVNGASEWRHTASILDGNLDIPTTTATVGQITQNGGTRILHTFGTDNTFVGCAAGSFAAGHQNNTGVGTNTLAALSTGDDNTALGRSSGTAVTTGIRNTLAGSQSGWLIVGGQENSCFGYGAGSDLSSGSENTLVGVEAGDSLTTTNGGVCLGYRAGFYETLANKLFIDNASRTDEATARVESLVYGVFNAATASQLFRINAATEILETLHMQTDSKGITFGGSSDMDIGYSGVYGYIRTDLVAASDLQIDCGTAKTIELQVPVTDDIQFQVSSGRVPAANNPSFDAFTTNTKEFNFAVDDFLYLDANEMDHWWQQGTPVNVHVHVTNETANSTGSDRYAKFTVYFAYAGDGDVWTETSVSGEWTIPTGTSAKTQKYLVLGSVDLSGKLIGTQIKATVKRIAATGGTEKADGIFITQVGVHALKDTMGSRQEITK
jgi:hypothetical protein